MFVESFHKESLNAKYLPFSHSSGPHRFLRHHLEDYLVILNYLH